MNNIISAIINLVENPRTELIRLGNSYNRANSMGEPLEEYVKDIFSGSMDETDDQIRNVIISNTFSYLGNKNNPPDIMLRGGNNGAAIEVKKIETLGASLALNSSYPKNKLYADSTLILPSCRQAEEGWSERDMIYVVGVVKKNTTKLTNLSFVYGEDYCADKIVYERILSSLKSGIESIGNIELEETNELAHVNRVDPLGITYFRARGMWGIKNPLSTFDYVYTPKTNALFNFMCIINDEKFNEFDNVSELFDLASHNNKLEISDVRIKDPNNPANLKTAKLITFYIGA